MGLEDWASNVYGGILGVGGGASKVGQGVLSFMDPAKPFNQEAAGLAQAQADAQQLSQQQWDRQMAGLSMALGYSKHSQDALNSVYGGKNPVVDVAPRALPTAAMFGPQAAPAAGAPAPAPGPAPFNPPVGQQAPLNPVMVRGPVPGGSRGPTAPASGLQGYLQGLQQPQGPVRQR